MIERKLFLQQSKKSHVLPCGIQSVGFAFVNQNEISHMVAPCTVDSAVARCQ